MRPVSACTCFTAASSSLTMVCTRARERNAGWRLDYVLCDAATAERKFNAVLATASINDAIEYHRLFDEIQQAKQAADPAFVPLNIACVFSPPAEGDADVRQIQEDLPQEKEDNQVDPEIGRAHV